MSDFFSEFSATSKAEWIEKVKTDLKGKDISTLNAEVCEGINISPFHHFDDFSPRSTPLDNHKEDNTWAISEHIKIQEYSSANKQALEALEGGANSLYLSNLALSLIHI